MKISLLLVSLLLAVVLGDKEESPSRCGEEGGAGCWGGGWGGQGSGLGGVRKEGILGQEERSSRGKCARSLRAE